MKFNVKTLREELEVDEKTLPLRKKEKKRLSKL